MLVCGKSEAKIRSTLAALARVSGWCPALKILDGELAANLIENILCSGRVIYFNSSLHQKLNISLEKINKIKYKRVR